MVHVMRGCSSEGYPEMVNGFLRLALVAIYLTKNAVNFAGQKRLLGLGRSPGGGQSRAMRLPLRCQIARRCTSTKRG